MKTCKVHGIRAAYMMLRLMAGWYRSAHMIYSTGTQFKKSMRKKGEIVSFYGRYHWLEEGL